MNNTTEELVTNRYGAPLAAPLADGNDTVHLQLRHRSVRKFLPEHVTDGQLNLIVAAAQSASSSSNLQPWSIIAVRDPERKQRLAEILAGQGKPIAACDVVLMFVVDYQRAAQIARERGSEIATLRYLENTLVGFVDCGIAGQNALLAAESMGLGGVFVGSVRNDPLALAAELGLPQYVFPAVGLAIGVPDPTENAHTKPRLPQAAVLHHECYDERAWRDAAHGYETRLAEYYAHYDKPDYSWARTLENRVGRLKGLYGREQVRQWLAEQGLPSD